MNFSDVKNGTKKASKEAVDRLNPLTTGGKWATVRNVAAIVGAIALLIPEAPFAVPAAVIAWSSWIAKIAGTVTLVTNLDKSKKNAKKETQPSGGEISSEETEEGGTTTIPEDNRPDGKPRKKIFQKWFK